MSKKRKPVLKGDRDELGKYVRDMADEMGLRDWTIVLSHAEPDDDDHGAECDVTYGRKLATITFRDDWVQWDAERIRQLVAHELLHVHTWPMEQRLCDLKDLIGESAYTVASLAFRDALEHAVDGIATEWAATLPLPIKAKEAA